MYIRRIIGFAKIFGIRFSVDLHVLRCPEHDLTIFRKCLSACLSVYMSPKFCGPCISRANAQKVTKLCIQLHLDKNWRWLDISGYRPIGGVAMPHFLTNFFLEYLISPGLYHGSKPDSDERILIREKSFWKIFLHIELQGALLLNILFEFRDSGIIQNCVHFYFKRTILS